MQKRIKSLLLDNTIWFAIIITIAIAYLSLIKTGDFPTIQISNIDKIYHVIAYFSLAISWLLSLTRIYKVNKYIVIFMCIIYGIIIEVLQTTLTMHRTGDFFDFLANTFGIVFALFIFNRFKKKTI